MKNFPSLLAAMILVAPLAAVAAVTSAVVVAAPAAADPYEPCSAPLDATRKEVYKFTDRGQELDHGRVVVIPTKQFRHRYCVRFQTGGGTVQMNYSRASFYFRDGKCGPSAGASGSGFDPSGPANYSLNVQAGFCERRIFNIRDSGRTYSASFLRIHR